MNSTNTSTTSSTHIINDAQINAQVNRGGLLEPLDHVMEAAILCWKVFIEIRDTPTLNKKFLTYVHQCDLFCCIMEDTFSERYDLFIGKTHCSKGHSVIEDLSRRFFNCFAKNLVHKLTESNLKECEAALSNVKKRKCDKLSGKF